MGSAFGKNGDTGTDNVLNRKIFYLYEEADNQKAKSKNKTQILKGFFESSKAFSLMDLANLSQSELS